MASRSNDDQHLRALARLRRVRDRIDPEYAKPLDFEALARYANMSAGHLSRQFKIAYGESPYSYAIARRPQRDRGLAPRGLFVPGHLQHPVRGVGRCPAGMRGIRDRAVRDPAATMIRIQELA